MRKLKFLTREVAEVKALIGTKKMDTGVTSITEVVGEIPALPLTSEEDFVGFNSAITQNHDLNVKMVSAIPKRNRMLRH